MENSFEVSGAVFFLAGGFFSFFSTGLSLSFCGFFEELVDPWGFGQGFGGFVILGMYSGSGGAGGFTFLIILLAFW